MNKRNLTRKIQKLLLVILFFGGIYGGLKMYMYYRVTKTVDKVAYDIKPIVDFRYGEIASSFDGTIGLTDVSLEVAATGDIIKIQSVTMDNGNLLGLYEFNKEFSEDRTPRYYNLHVSGFSIDLNSRLVEIYRDAANLSHPPFPEKEKLLNCGDIFKLDPKLIADLGYADSAMDFSMVVDLRAPIFKFEVSIFYPDDTEVVIKASFDAGDAYKSRIPVADRMKLKDFEMVLNPGSFLEESMNYCMKKENATREQVSQAFLQQFEQRMTELKIKPDKDMLNEYKKFLNTPSQLVVTANPREPLDLATMEKYDPADVPGLLNMGFTVQ